MAKECKSKSTVPAASTTSTTAENPDAKGKAAAQESRRAKLRKAKDAKDSSPMRALAPCTSSSDEPSVPNISKAGVKRREKDPGEGHERCSTSSGAHQAKDGASEKKKSIPPLQELELARKSTSSKSKTKSPEIAPDSIMVPPDKAAVSTEMTQSSTSSTPMVVLSSSEPVSNDSNTRRTFSQTKKSRSINGQKENSSQSTPQRAESTEKTSKSRPESQERIPATTKITPQTTSDSQGRTDRCNTQDIPSSYESDTCTVSAMKKVRMMDTNATAEKTGHIPQEKGDTREKTLCSQGIVPQALSPSLPSRLIPSQYIDRLGRSHDITLVNAAALCPPATEDVLIETALATPVSLQHIRPEQNGDTPGTRMRQNNLKSNEVCRRWLRRECLSGTRCHNLHQLDGVCRPYLEDRCNFGVRCYRIHPPRQTTAKILNSSSQISLNDQIKGRIRIPQQSKPVIITEASGPDGQPKTDEICWDYLKGRCCYGHRCRYVHVSSDELQSTLITPSVTKTNDTPENISAGSYLTLHHELFAQSLRDAIYCAGPSYAAVNLPKSGMGTPPMEHRSKPRLRDGKERAEDNSRRSENLASANLQLRDPILSEGVTFEVKSPRPDKGHKVRQEVDATLEGRSTSQPRRYLDIRPSDSRSERVASPGLIEHWDSEPDHSGWHLDSQSSDGGTDTSFCTLATLDSSPPRSSDTTNWPRPPLPPGVCFDWLNGNCRRGLMCIFLHGDHQLGDERHASSAKRHSPLPPDIPPAPHRPIPASTNCLSCALGQCTGKHHTSCTENSRQYPLAPPGLSKQTMEPSRPADKPQPQRSSALSSQQGRESPPYLIVTVLDHTQVKFGSGFEVLDATTGFESQWIFLGNVPASATEADIYQILEPFGRVNQVKLPSDLRHDSPIIVKAQFSDPTEASQAVGVLNGAQIFDTIISARLSSSHTGSANGRLRDTTLRLTWDAPERIGFAGYPTLEDAETAISSANGFSIKGYVISAELYQGLPAIGRFNVRFKGLPPYADEKTMQKFAPSNAIMMKQPNYTSVDNAVRSIRRLMEEYGDVLNIQTMPPPYRDGVVKAWADFVSPHAARTVRDAVSGRKLWSIGRTRLAVRHIQDVSYTLTGHTFDKLSPDIISLRDFSWQKGLRTFISIVDHRDVNPTAPVVVKLSGENSRELGQLKSEFEKISRGEKVMEDGKAAWDGFFARPMSYLFLVELEAQNPGIRIQVHVPSRTITLFGHTKNRVAARLAILAKIAHLRAQQIRPIPLAGKLIGIFMSADLIKLQQELGPENVILDLCQRRLVVRGNDAAYEAAQAIVRLAQHRRPGKRSSTSECPVCLDEVTSPITLECGHSWCRACLASYFVAAKDHKLFPLTCLGDEANCSARLSMAVARDILSASEFEAVANASFLAYVHSRPAHFHYCPTPDCGQVYRASSHDTILQCPSCLVRICPKCRVEYHDGMTCEERDNEGEKLFKEWRESHGVKSCPGCKSHIQRSEGCNHMTCTHCQTHICWVCMATFPRGEGIYDHMRMMHGGIGL